MFLATSLVAFKQKEARVRGLERFQSGEERRERPVLAEEKQRRPCYRSLLVDWGGDGNHP